MRQRLFARREPIITGWQARVRHLPMFMSQWDTAPTFKILCKEDYHGWFWRPGLVNEPLEDVQAGRVKKPPKLPLCAECERRYHRQAKSYQEAFHWILKHRR